MIKEELIKYINKEIEILNGYQKKDDLTEFGEGRLSLLGEIKELIK